MILKNFNALESSYLELFLVQLNDPNGAEAHLVAKNTIGVWDTVA
jgi:hypothetical protein